MLSKMNKFSFFIK